MILNSKHRLFDNNPTFFCVLTRTSDVIVHPGLLGIPQNSWMFNYYQTRMTSCVYEEWGISCKRVDRIVVPCRDAKGARCETNSYNPSKPNL